ncbi:MAG: MASE1 domain-containing protein [Gemmataceae bacterium]
MSSTTSLRACNPWISVALFSVAYAGAASLGMLFRTTPENFAIFWPPNGVLVGALLVVSRNRHVVYLAASAAMSFVVNLAFGHDVAPTGAFTAVNVAESYAAARLISWLGGEPFRMDRASRVFLLFVIAVVICSFTGSIGGLVVYYGLGAPDLWSAMVMFGMADALGIMIFAPLILAWSEFEVRSLASASPRRIAEIAIIVAVVLGVGFRIFNSLPGTAPPHRMYAFPVVPFLLWAAVRFGAREATAVLSMLALIAVWYTGRGLGPFCMSAPAVAHRLLLAQLFLSIVGLTVLSLAGAIAERKRVEEQLRESRERYRMVMKTIQEVFWVATPGLQQFEYVSPAYEEVWQRSRERLVGDPGEFARSICPEDRLRSPLAASSTSDACEYEYRILRGDGAVRWIRTRVFPAIDEGQVTRIVGVSSDITDRKEAELANVKLIGELQTALTEIKTLRGLVPICAWCKDIRNDTGFWQKLEDYLQTHTEARFTHGICPSCLQKETSVMPMEA